MHGAHWHCVSFPSHPRFSSAFLLQKAENGRLMPVLRRGAKLFRWVPMSPNIEEPLKSACPCDLRVFPTLKPTPEASKALLSADMSLLDLCDDILRLIFVSMPGICRCDPARPAVMLHEAVFTLCTLELVCKRFHDPAPDCSLPEQVPRFLHSAFSPFRPIRWESPLLCLVLTTLFSSLFQAAREVCQLLGRKGRPRAFRGSASCCTWTPASQSGMLA